MKQVVKGRAKSVLNITHVCHQCTRQYRNTPLNSVPQYRPGCANPKMGCLTTTNFGSRQASASVATSAAKGFLRELQELKDEADCGSNGSEPSTTSSPQPRGYGSKSSLKYDLPLSIVKYPDPRLRAQNSKISTFDENLAKLAREMFDIMYRTDGVGLAAPQVGANVRLMVYNPEGEPEKGVEHVLVNPKIITLSKDTSLFEEGCLSFPKIYGDVKRPKGLTVEAQDLQGEKFRLELDGLQARIFQHEYDHLEGKLFHDRMSPKVLHSVKEQLIELEKAFAEKNPDVKYRGVK